MDELTERVRSGTELDAVAVAAATNSLLDESLSVESKADFLEALSEKGETPAEIAAFAEAFLERAVEPELDRAALDRPLLDVCGTGGDRLDLFNVSTASVFVLAAAGVAVVKHGNRGITSQSGGADVLEALGIRIDEPADEFGRCVAEVGVGFLFAPNYHPAFKAVGPVRKLLAERGRRTIFNLLGPLLNPARPDYQMIGVYDAALGPVFAEILRQLGRKRAWAVHGSAGGDGGMDELSTLAQSQLWSTDPADPLRGTIDPGSLGLSPATLDELRGGDATKNAAILTGIFDRSLGGSPRDLVLLNSAAGLVVSGMAGDLAEGLERAAEAVASGGAADVLERWRAFS